MPTPPVQRLARHLLVAAFALVAALLGASLFRRPAELVSAAVAAGTPVPPGAPAAAPATVSDGYDLSSIEVLRKVVVQIKDNYVEPQRIQAREMYMAALEGVEKNNAEVMVEGSAQDGKARVTCGSQVKDFDFRGVESLWMVPDRIRPVFAFLQGCLPAGENRHDVEYAAINGMLGTLDPHSWLLRPDAYKEMKMQTRGEFGGLGFVVSMDEDRLIVRKVLKDTPASRAGLRRGDHIARIEDESTINMDLSEAVSKLRGKPGTEVRVWIRRDEAGADEAEKLYRLTRALISYESVTSRLLEGQVGYVRLSSFAGTTARDLLGSIRRLRAEGGGQLRGLVLDLRSNPGGLLDQAVQVVDLFVKQGTIVSTQARNERDAKQARTGIDEDQLPLVLLVNSESASASEIVAGAMRGLNRGLVVGRQTFGKGSVQQLFEIAEPVSGSESALKLTIAQYLTTGDRSIQEIGVTPDIEIVPARIQKERVDVFSPPRVMREADLDKHFANGFAPPNAQREAPVVEQPAERLRYLRDLPAAPATDKVTDKGSDKGGVKPAKGSLKGKVPGRLRAPKDADDEDEMAIDEPDDDQIAQDFQVRFARELLLRAPSNDRLKMIEAARAFVEEKRASENVRIRAAIEALGVDWSASAPAATPPGLQVDVQQSPEHAVPGEPLDITVTVRNTSTTPAEQLRAFTRCDAEKTAYQGLCQLMARREFLFGRVAPGQQRSWTTQVAIPAHLPAVHEVLSLVFEDAHGQAPSPRPVVVESQDVRRPAFAFSVQVLDTDGRVQPGETAQVQIDVKNVGAGPSGKNAYVSIKSLSGDKLFVKKGRLSLGVLQPGEVRSAVLTAEVRGPGAHSDRPTDGSEAAQEAEVPSGRVGPDELALKVEAGDRTSWEFTSAVVKLPRAVDEWTIEPASGTARTTRPASIRAAVGGAGTSPEVGSLQAGAAVPVRARAKREGSSLWQVEWQKGRVGWIDAEGVSVAAAAKADPASKVVSDKISAIYPWTPPTLVVSDLPDQRSPVVVRTPRWTISGHAEGGRLADLRVFVDNEKVFFRTAPQEGSGASRLELQADVPLKPGNNQVTVVARIDEDLTTQRTLIVYREPDTAASTGAPSAVAPAGSGTAPAAH